MEADHSARVAHRPEIESGEASECLDTGRGGALVLHEPRANLPEDERQGVIDWLQRERQRRGALLVIGADPAIAATADSVVVMHSGRVVERGPANEVLARPAHPYTRAMTSSTASRGGRPLLGSEQGCSYAERCPIARTRCRVEVPAAQPFSLVRASACHYFDDVLDGE